MGRLIQLWIGSSGPFIFDQESNQPPFRYSIIRNFKDAASRSVSRSAGSEGRTGHPTEQMKIDQAFAGVSVDMFTAYHAIHSQWKQSDLDKSQLSDLGIGASTFSIGMSAISDNHIPRGDSGTSLQNSGWEITDDDVMIMPWHSDTFSTTLNPNTARLKFLLGNSTNSLNKDFSLVSDGIQQRWNGLTYFKQGMTVSSQLHLTVNANSPDFLDNSTYPATTTPPGGGSIIFGAYKEGFILGASIYTDNGNGLSGVTDTLIIDAGANDILIRSNGTTGNIAFSFANFLTLQADDGVIINSNASTVVNSNQVVNGILEVVNGDLNGLRLKANANSDVTNMSFYPVGASPTIVGGSMGFPAIGSPHMSISNIRPAGKLTMYALWDDAILQSVLGDVLIKSAAGNTILEDAVEFQDDIVMTTSALDVNSGGIWDLSLTSLAVLVGGNDIFSIAASGETLVISEEVEVTKDLRAKGGLFVTGLTHDIDVDNVFDLDVNGVNFLNIDGTSATVNEPWNFHGTVSLPEAAVTDHEAAIDHDALTNFAATEHFIQGAISIPASQISDFDTEVSNNASVTLNTAKNPKDSKTITVESPGASEDITMFYTDVAITITIAAMVLIGSSTPSVTLNIVHGTDRSAAGNNLWTTDEVVTTVTVDDAGAAFVDATIVAGSFIWLETQAQSGTVTELSVTLFYTVD